MRSLLLATLLATAAIPVMAAPMAKSMAAPQAAIQAAIANPTRPAADRAADAQRKPAATLAFAGVKPGDAVVDVLPGSGYFTQLFCGVVGSQGQIYDLNFTELAKLELPPPFKPACANVATLTQAVAAITTPQPVDVIFTARNYHDFHNAMFGKPDMLALDKSIYNALKPGGLFIVLDHADAPGTGFAHTDTLHRVDAAAVRKEVQAAGFMFVASSTALHNPADDHSKTVFDPAIRGHTDQFMLKFRRPK